MLATAADIPADLFDLILSFYKVGDWNRHQRYNYVLIHKRKLGAISLVCRRWADLCQPKLLPRVIQLQSLADAEELLGLMNDPSSHVGGYLKTITFVLPTCRCRVPWIHIACRKLQHCTKLSPAVQFRLDAGEMADKELAKAISSPLSGYSGIMCVKSLHLTRVIFPQLEGLGRVVRKFPCLQEAHFVRVEWKGSEHGEFPELRSLPTGRRAPACTFKMIGCTDNWAALWLASLDSSNRTRRLRKEDLQALWRLVDGIYRGAFTVRSWRETDAIYVDALGMWRLKATLSSTPQSRSHIRRIQFSTLDWTYTATQCTWMMLDEHFTNFADLQEIDFHSNSSKDMEAFAMRTVAHAMPRLCCSSKLQFTLASHANGGNESQTVCMTGVVRRAIETSLEKRAQQCAWTLEQISALLAAFRDHNRRAYMQLQLKLHRHCTQNYISKFSHARLDFILRRGLALNGPSRLKGQSAVAGNHLRSFSSDEILLRCVMSRRRKLVQAREKRASFVIFLTYVCPGMLAPSLFLSVPPSTNVETVTLIAFCHLTTAVFWPPILTFQSIVHHHISLMLPFVDPSQAPPYDTSSSDVYRISPITAHSSPSEHPAVW
ncbi:hypothetical protein NM688_g2713 [Phlebia brevispora]|uniref:Uncharacterized protein n=1 Tax=Phlebia brevispora TaxID=194682 RepID=A0ACC1T7Q6_9APHY|nr:hypothetical protein NM688_g2713 [Phlebia brevispora]